VKAEPSKKSTCQKILESLIAEEKILETPSHYFKEKHGSRLMSVMTLKPEVMDYLSADQLFKLILKHKIDQSEVEVAIIKNLPGKEFPGVRVYIAEDSNFTKLLQNCKYVGRRAWIWYFQVKTIAAIVKNDAVTELAENIKKLVTDQD
jgi:hypothetical protein